MIRKALALFLFLSLWLHGAHFTFAVYNVENLFDLHYDQSEYPEYIPFTATQWNKKNYAIKLRNIAKVIKALKADIIALSEIESKRALLDLRATLTKKGVSYRYYAITSKKKTTVHTALLSRFPIIKTQEIMVDPYDRIRSILKVYLKIKTKTLIIYVNHWKSKGGPESKRIPYAKALMRDIKQNGSTPYIISGDLNENYNEMHTFKKSRKLNDTKGITGINHILNTSDFKHVYRKYEITKNSFRHYNLWMELPKKWRWSHNFYGRHGSLDHIIIPYSLLDGKGIDYIAKSFNRFRAPYLIKKGRINRWKISRKHPLHHTGRGFSDHLPIFAKFSY